MDASVRVRLSMAIAALAICVIGLAIVGLTPPG